MPVDRIVARQCHGTFGNPMFEDERNQHPRQSPCRPSSHRKHTMITASIPRPQFPDGTQQVADGSRSDRQNCCRQNDQKPTIGPLLRKGLSRCGEQRYNLPWNPIHDELPCSRVMGCVETNPSYPQGSSFSYAKYPQKRAKVELRGLAEWG